MAIVFEEVIARVEPDAESAAEPQPLPARTPSEPMRRALVRHELAVLAYRASRLRAD